LEFLACKSPVIRRHYFSATACLLTKKGESLFFAKSLGPRPKTRRNKDGVPPLSCPTASKEMFLVSYQGTTQRAIEKA
jgi:hypothetical protein